MGSFQIEECGIKINGTDITKLNPNKVRELIAGLPEDERKVVYAVIEEKLHDNYEEMTGISLPDNYAKHAGRPSLKDVPYGQSENDGYPFLPGHSPLCDGQDYHNGMCECKYREWNEPGGEINPMTSEVWPGGPTFDDFDM